MVDHSQIVHNRDCAGRALTLALLAADAAVAAGLAGVDALVVVAAANKHGNGFGNNVDQMVGACLGTQTAADTQFGVDGRQSVLHVDGIIGAGSNTVAITKTAIGTGTVTCEEQLCSRGSRRFNCVRIVLADKAMAIVLLHLFL